LTKFWPRNNGTIEYDFSQKDEMSLPGYFRTKEEKATGWEPRLLFIPTAWRDTPAMSKKAGSARILSGIVCKRGVA